MKRIDLYLSLVLLLCLVSSLSAQDSLEVRCVTELYDYWGEPYSIDITENYCYVATSDGLRIVNFGDIDNPRQVGIRVEIRVVDLDLDGDFAYMLVENPGGLAIYNAEDLVHPFRVGFCELEGIWMDIQVQDDLAYIATEDRGLIIVDVSDRENPEVVGNWDEVELIRAVDVKDNFVYAACDTLGFYIINANEPEDPQYAGMYDSTGCVVDVDVVDSLAFISDAEGSRIILDISNLEEIEFVCVHGFTTDNKNDDRR